MTTWDWLRFLIMASAAATILLWLHVGRKTKKWGTASAALSFLVPVLCFFTLRVFYREVNVLNYISLGLYLEAVCLLASMALGALGARR